MYKAPPLEIRFWTRVNKTDSCWIWVGQKRHGKLPYGMLWIKENGKLVSRMAHRISWELHNGEIPKNQCVLHDCPFGDNPSCVNPKHLWLGTRIENNKDRDSKGRTVKAGCYVKGWNRRVK